MNNRRHKIFKLELARQIFAFIANHPNVDKHYGVSSIWEHLCEDGKFCFNYTDHFSFFYKIGIHLGDHSVSCKINSSDSWFAELNKLHTKDLEWKDIHNGKGWNVDTYTKLQLFFWLKSLEVWAVKYWDDRNDYSISKILKKEF